MEASLVDVNLYVGSVIAAHDSEWLAQIGITRVISLENLDSGSMDIGLLVTELEEAIALGTPVLLHCQLGISRSGAIAVAYIMKKHLMDYTTALAYVRKGRPCVTPSSLLRTRIASWITNQPYVPSLHSFELEVVPDDDDVDVEAVLSEVLELVPTYSGIEITNSFNVPVSYGLEKLMLIGTYISQDQLELLTSCIESIEGIQRAELM